MLMKEMKEGLLRKILAPVLCAATLFAAKPVSAEEEELPTQSSPGIYFSIGTGVYSCPSIKKGTFITGNIGAELEFGGFGAKTILSYMGNSGTSSIFQKRDTAYLTVPFGQDLSSEFRLGVGTIGRTIVDKHIEDIVRGYIAEVGFDHQLNNRGHNRWDTQFFAEASLYLMPGVGGMGIKMSGEITVGLKALTDNY